MSLSCLHGRGSIIAMATCCCCHGALCIALALALLPQRQPRHVWQHVHMSILGRLLAADAYGAASVSTSFPLAVLVLAFLHWHQAGVAICFAH